MSDKKKRNWEIDDPREIPKKRWLGGFEDYSPNGYSLEDEYGWTSRNKDEMYDEAVRDLKALLGAKKEQRKVENPTEEKK
jgi:hypothetical protein